MINSARIASSRASCAQACRDLAYLSDCTTSGARLDLIAKVLDAVREMERMLRILELRVNQ